MLRGNPTIAIAPTDEEHMAEQGKPQQYIVHAAVYSDMTFQSAVAAGTEEILGPFNRYEEAYNAWRSVSQREVDNCYHKARILIHKER